MTVHPALQALAGAALAFAVCLLSFLTVEYVRDESSGSYASSPAMVAPQVVTSGISESFGTPTPTIPAGPLVVILATETPVPTTPPKPTKTPRPECPDNPVAPVHCYKVAPTATPGPTPTVAIAPTPASCDLVASGSCIQWPRLPGE
jgi:hypothetical protein